MELRKAADVLLRSQSNPVSSLLKPSSGWTRGTQLCQRTTNYRPLQRCLTISARKSAVRPGATTSTSPPPSSDTDDFLQNSKNLWERARKSPSPSLPKVDGQREKRMNGGNSGDDILAWMNAADALSKTKTPQSSLDLSGMIMPANLADKQATPLDVASRAPSIPKVPLRLRPSTGRTVAIEGNVDVARGLKMLEQSCARNKIRSMATKQRFHERPGLMKKRLKRTRWRVRFMEGFRATVGRVKELRDQGW